ncbi:MAG: SDR family oxidoreductase [Pseudomonadota bacterium]
MRSFEGCVAVVTGAASGIGEALAIELSRRGAHLALADIDQSELNRVADVVRSPGSRCSVHHVDVAHRDQVEQFAQDVLDSHGGAQLLINNAGVALADFAATQRYADFERVMNINFWGVVYGTRAFLPLLSDAKAAHIVNISSLFGLGALPSQSAYNASKFAVRGYTEALKMELADTAIGVSCVHPGGVKTNIVRNSVIAEAHVPMNKQRFIEYFDRLAMTTPEQAAQIILKGVSKNKRRILVGRDARFADFIIRLFPGSYERWLKLERPITERWRSLRGR